MCKPQQWQHKKYIQTTLRAFLVLFLWWCSYRAIGALGLTIVEWASLKAQERFVLLSMLSWTVLWLYFSCTWVLRRANGAWLTRTIWLLTLLCFLQMPNWLLAALPMSLLIIFYTDYRHLKPFN